MQCFSSFSTTIAIRDLLKFELAFKVQGNKTKQKPVSGFISLLRSDILFTDSYFFLGLQEISVANPRKLSSE